MPRPHCVNAHKGGPDLARAKQLLADAGLGNGLTLTYMVKSQVPVLVKTNEWRESVGRMLDLVVDGLRYGAPGHRSAST